MKIKLNTTLQMILLPVAIFAYVKTGSMWIYYGINIFTWFAFLMVFFVFGIMMATLDKMPPEKIQELRDKTIKKPLRRVVFFFTSIAVGTCLYIYVNSIVGILQLSAILMMELIRHRLLTKK